MIRERASMLRHTYIAYRVNIQYGLLNVLGMARACRNMLLWQFYGCIF